MPSFSQRLQQRIARVGPLCVGIDPSPALLARCELPDSPAGLLDFGARIIEAGAERIAVLKPQMAYFERHGSLGLAALEQLLAQARSAELPVILDGKRGDIDATATAYGEAYFARQAPLRCDALTVHAYLGFGALAGLIEQAVSAAAGVFVVVRSSNPEGSALQLARQDDGDSVAASLARAITRVNAEHDLTAAFGPIGAVVGATCDDAAGIVELLPRALILAPGVGAQGATCADIARRMPGARGRVLPNVSRAVFAGGASQAALREHLARLQQDAAQLC